jgi:hypothetical protein
LAESVRWGGCRLSVVETFGANLVARLRKEGLVWGWVLGGELAVLQAAMLGGLFLDGGALGVDLPVAA